MGLDIYGVTLENVVVGRRFKKWQLRELTRANSNDREARGAFFLLALG